MMTLTKFYTGFLESNRVDLISDLVDLHAHTVDPRELTVSIQYFQTLVSEEALKDCPECRLYLLFSDYTTETTRFQASGPSV